MNSGSLIEKLTPQQITQISDKNFFDIYASTRLTFSAAQFEALGNLRIASPNSLADTAENLLHITPEHLATLGAHGVDFVDVLDNQGVLPLTVAQSLAFAGAGVPLAANDHVTVVDAGELLAALTPQQISTLNAKGFLGLDGGASSWSLTVAQYNALGSMALGGSGAVTVAGTAGELLSLGFQAMKDKGVDVLDVTGSNVLTLTPAQAKAFAASDLMMAAGDSIVVAGAVVLAKTADHFSNLTVAEITALKDSGITTIDALRNDGSTGAAQIGWDWAKAKAFADSEIILSGEDSIRIQIVPTAFPDILPADLANLRGAAVFVLDTVDPATDHLFTLTAAQYAALGNRGFAEVSATVTLSDTAANLGALDVAKFQALFAKNIDVIHVSDHAPNANGVLSLTVDKAIALIEGGIERGLLFGGTDIKVLDSATNLNALSADTNRQTEAKRLQGAWRHRSLVDQCR